MKAKKRQKEILEKRRKVMEQKLIHNDDDEDLSLVLDEEVEREHNLVMIELALTR
tara:strand:+ start:335 stop:499 length:165 start_codon:yes stop_codon:yes gene_type:complete